jgi:hypothetical protein
MSAETMTAEEREWMDALIALTDQRIKRAVESVTAERLMFEERAKRAESLLRWIDQTVFDRDFETAVKDIQRGAREVLSKKREAGA